MGYKKYHQLITIIFLIGELILCAGFGIINKVQAQTTSTFSFQRKTGAHSRSHPAPITPSGSLYDQATAQARKFWDTKMTRCGDSYYTIDNRTIFQFKGVTIAVVASRISEADRLNGIEWEGVSQVNVSNSRLYSPSGSALINKGWNQWVSGLNMAVGLAIKLRKQGGQWSITSDRYSEVNDLRPISCSDAMNPEQFFARIDSAARTKDLEAKYKIARANGLYTHNLPNDMFEAIYDAMDRADFRLASFAPNGGWIVLRNGFGYKSNGMPADVGTQLNEFNKKNISAMVQASFTFSGGWIFVYGVNEKGWTWKDVPQKLLDTLQALSNQDGLRYDNLVKDIVFAPNGGWVLITGDYNGHNKYAWENLPADVVTALTKLINQGSYVYQIAFTSKGGWVILYDYNGYLTNNIPEELFKTLTEVNGNRKQFYRLALGPKDEWMLFTGK